MALAKYRVILNGNVMPECDRQQVIEGLAELFNSQASTMENLLKGHAVSLKKQYDKAQAQIICNNIKRIGAQCSVAVIAESELEAETATVAEAVASESALRKTTTSTASAGDSASCRQSDKETFQTLLMCFVGSNTDYYRHQFSKFTVIHDNSRHGNSTDDHISWSALKFSWHWPAFFCFFFWALYRKMWSWAALQALASIGLMLWIKSDMVYLVWLVMWAVLANFLYFRKAVAAVNRTLERTRNRSDENTEVAHYLERGGVSKGAVFGGILIALVSVIMVSNYMTSRFMDEYGEQLNDVLPGSGTQFRGDGLSLEGVVAESKLARTSLILSVLATSLKILLITTDPQIPSTAHPLLSLFIEQIEGGEVSDGWGNAVRIEQQVNQYVLISAGADQFFKTDDDVLQPIAIPEISF